MKCKILNNKEMNNETYLLRKKVIELIYEAKKLFPELPRITVRVAENDKKILGAGRIGHNIIWITESFVASRAVVFHEILHASFAVEHVQGCPLMNDQIDPNLPEKFCNKLFLKYARKDLLRLIEAA